MYPAVSEASGLWNMTFAQLGEYDSRMISAPGSSTQGMPIKCDPSGQGLLPYVDILGVPSKYVHEIWADVANGQTDKSLNQS